jgi:hypothetical protein
MQDLLHFKQLGALLTLLRPLARTMGPWPFVVLVSIVLTFLAFASFELFGFAHQVLEIVIVIIKAALSAAFFLVARRRPRILASRLKELVTIGSIQTELSCHFVAS